MALAAAALLLVGCAHFITRDYMFGVTVVVRDDRGTAVGDASVALELGSVVYEAVTPVRSAQCRTNGTGGCIFRYISHQAMVEYKVAVRKEGYVAQVMSGVASPQADVVVELKTAQPGDGPSWGF